MSSLEHHNTMSFNQNDRSKKFAEEVKTIVESAKEPTYKAIAEKLKWNNNALHLVIKGERNVPNDVYRRYTEIYNIKDENEDYKDLYIEQLKEMNTLLKKRVTDLERVFSQLTAIEKTIAEVRTDMGMMAALQRGYQEYWAEHYHPKNVSPAEVVKTIRSKAFSSLQKIQKEGIQI